MNDLAKLQTLIIAELDPSRPVPEACAVIDTLIKHNNPIHEEEILLGIKAAIDNLLTKKGAGADGKPVRGNNGK